MARRVLIADDEANIVISLEFLMQQSGYEVRVARNGDEALAAVEAFAPDLVLLDVMMPRKNGYEVLQAIRANFRYGGSVSSCTTGSYNDHDDLIFAVQ